MSATSYLEINLHNKNVRLPSNQILILSPERSGSTWLFDSLRWHPGIFMEKSAELFSFCCARGRRYPADLSLSIDRFPNSNYIEVETTEKNIELVPECDLKIEENNYTSLITSNYAIEKFHPHFFDFNFKIFQEKTKCIENHINVKYIILSREPKTAISSFLSYQRRNKNWNRSINSDSVVNHYKKAYDFLFAVLNFKNCIAVRYEDLKNKYNKTLYKIFKYLWGDIIDNNRSQHLELINKIKIKTIRESRISKQSSSFFGKEEGTIEKYNIIFDQFIKSNSDAIKRCNCSWNNQLVLLTPNNKQSLLKVIKNFALEITQLNYSNGQVAGSLQHCNANITKLKSENKRNRDKLSALEEKNKQLKDNQNDLNSNNNQLKDMLSALEYKNNQLKDKLNVIEYINSQFMLEFNKMKDNINLLNRKKETLEQDKSQLQKNINLTKKKIEYLQKMVEKKELSYQIIVNSWSFRLGRIICLPIRLIRNFFKPS
jgi:hypothetical protein